MTEKPISRFTVFFSVEADEEVLKSYEWGLLFWGQERANTWLREFYSSVKKRLGDFPLSYGLSPESSYLESEVRQIHIGRYRVLFEIEGSDVTVIRVVGPYAEMSDAKAMPLE